MSYLICKWCCTCWKHLWNKDIARQRLDILIKEHYAVLSEGNHIGRAFECCAWGDPNGDISREALKNLLEDYTGSEYSEEEMDDVMLVVFLGGLGAEERMKNAEDKNVIHDAADYKKLHKIQNFRRAVQYGSIHYGRNSEKLRILKNHSLYR